MNNSKAKSILSTLVAFLVTWSIASTASAEEFIVDQKNSSIIFMVEHLVGYSFGHVKDFKGTVTLDKKNRIKELSVTADMSTLNTFNERRDELMRSEKFFNVEKYPQAKLTAKKFKDDAVTVEVEILGNKEKIDFEYRFWGVAEDDKGKKKTAITMVGYIQRKDYDLEYNPKTQSGEEILGEELEIMLDLRAIKQ